MRDPRIHPGTAGDIIGSVYEQRPIKRKDFSLFDPGCRFTDDMVLTVALAEAILSGRSYGETIREFGRRSIRVYLRTIPEPPDADPHVRWCGGTAGVTPPPTRLQTGRWASRADVTG